MGKDKEERNKELYRNGEFLKTRSCTDCPMVLFWLIFLGGWAAVTGVAISKGKPSRILLPEDFNGNLCGEGAQKDYKRLYIPRPSRLSYGICVSECPPVSSVVCNSNNRNLNQSASAWAASPSSTTVGAISRFECFFVFYSTSQTLNRCLPFNTASNSKSLYTAAGESEETVKRLSDTLGVGDFFKRGFGEVDQSKWVIAIAAGTAFIVSLMWVILLRFIMAPIVYLSLLFILGVLIAIGYFAKKLADDLENVRLPNDTATKDQVIIWRIVQYVFFVGAGIYFVVMLFMLKRIRIGIEVMKEGSKAFVNSWGIVFLPIFTFVLVFGVSVFFLVVMLYIQTVGKIDKQSFVIAVKGTVSSPPSPPVSASSTQWKSDNTVKAMHAYNLFGFLWTANALLCAGFMVQAFVVSGWYFSATTQDLDADDRGIEGGRVKEAPSGSLCLAMKATLVKHLGTVLWGSLLIAIVQFIRVVFLYLQDQILEPYKGQPLVSCIVCLIDCCLAYIERMIKIITRNAFIVCCCSNESFCPSAREALSILVDNIARVGVLEVMSSIAYFLLKLFITATNCVIGYVLIRIEKLTDDRKVESGLFPLAGIFLVSFVIASMFMSSFEAATDTVMMCFLYDEKHLEGTFLSLGLSKLLDNFGDVAKARKEYEDKLRSAVKSV